MKSKTKITWWGLTTIGKKTYNLIFSEIYWLQQNHAVETLRNHYEPKRIVKAERFHFHKREQHEGEGVAAYSAALKKCTEHCAFGTFLEEAVGKPICLWLEKQMNSEKA